MPLTPEKLSVVSQSKGKLGSLPFEAMRKKILGSRYELTIVFATPKKIQELNKTYRQKEYVPNVLSFPLTKTSGEIYACLSQIKKEAPERGELYDQFLPFLMIHSMLHLKGYSHGSKMEREESRFMRIFGFTKKSTALSLK